MCCLLRINQLKYLFLGLLQITPHRTRSTVNGFFAQQIRNLICCLAQSGIIEATAISIFNLRNSSFFFLRAEGEAGCFQFSQVKRFGTNFQIVKLIQRLVQLCAVLGLRSLSFLDLLLSAVDLSLHILHRRAAYMRYCPNCGIIFLF